MVPITASIEGDGEMLNILFIKNQRMDHMMAVTSTEIEIFIQLLGDRLGPRLFTSISSSVNTIGSKTRCASFPIGDKTSHIASQCQILSNP